MVDAGGGLQEGCQPGMKVTPVDTGRSFSPVLVCFVDKTVPLVMQQCNKVLCVVEKTLSG